MDLLRDYPVVIEAPLAWGEMDALQHINNTVYFRWFESARIAYFDAVGMMAHMETSSVGPILASTRCRFRIPLDYPDRVSIGARVDEIGDDRFLMRYAVISHAAGATAADGEGVIVMFDYQSERKAPLPDDLRARIVELEATVGNEPAPMARRP